MDRRAWRASRAKDLQTELDGRRCAVQPEKWDEAIAAYRAILSTDAGAQRRSTCRSRAAYRGKKDYDGAWPRTTRCSRIDPDNEKAKSASAHDTTSNAATSKAAEETLAAGRGSTPAASRDVFYTLGEVKSAKGETDEASKWYQKASAADPSWGKPLYKLGLLAHRTRATSRTRAKLLRPRDRRRSGVARSRAGENRRSIS